MLESENRLSLTGDIFIGSTRKSNFERFYAIDPSLGTAIEDTGFSVATPSDVAEACERADAAFVPYANLPVEARAAFLETIAEELELQGDMLLERAKAETGLPIARLTGERGRTATQLRFFAAILREGKSQEWRHEPSDPKRVPRKPDLRLRKMGLGPVAVFGASNFPLAFSVAGGDTASALAAGCPVVVKGHPAHPGTSELAARAILRAAERTDMPDGVFSLLNGPSKELGAALVSHPLIQAVGFTGSRAGGIALMRLAANRPVPIPVYAEMSSINPVILMPSALASRGAQLAEGYVASVTAGAGQFCTNPGLVLAVDGPELTDFLGRAAELISATGSQTMLNDSIYDAYRAGKARLKQADRTRLIAEGHSLVGPNQGSAAVFELNGSEFLINDAYAQEIFGATSIVVRCSDLDEVKAILRALEGQLTATLQLDEQDFPAAKELVSLLERKVGRIVVNGWPTGVEVSPAMVHGGPFPASSDGRSTSVGGLAIDRFLRPICYQDFPMSLLGLM